MNINNALKSAFELHQSGKLEEAEITYKKILHKQPKNADALHLLGILHQQLGNNKSAIQYLKRALQADPNFAEAYNNLGNAVKEEGHLDEAITYYQKAVQIDTNFAGAYNNLGNIYLRKGQPDNALHYIQKALQISPDLAEAHCSLGNILKSKGQLDAAITCYQKAIQYKFHYFAAYNNLGVAYIDKGHFDEALTCYQKAVQLNPHSPEAYNGIGIAMFYKGEFTQAVSFTQKALTINPNYADAYRTLGAIFIGKGSPVEAENHLRHALYLKPDYPVAYSSLLLYLHYHSLYDAHAVFAEHLRFAKQFTEPLSAVIVPHINDRSTTRRLRVGYVSPDFRKHSVGFFIDPVLASHNHQEFEIFCYHNLQLHDEMTEQIKEHADHWQSIAGMSDEKVTELIRNDRIDILVDLAGHTGENRILVFARKPAPVQVSWIGYPNTTGLSQMDYKIVDSFTDPVDRTDQLYTEKLIRLPESFLCYLPYRDSPQIGQLPALKNGHITFGSFNILAKISPEVVRVWSGILKTIPNSRMIVKTSVLFDSTTRDEVIKKFIREGIQGDRIDLLSRMPTFSEHLDTYNSIDIGLDTFPYNGTTTTCEALWMGVPVVALEGDTHVSRVGVSLLSNAGIPELLAKTPEEYISIAVDLAGDLKRLQFLREHLRDMMTESPLCDAKRFTVNLESCYRRMWETWCKSA